MSDASWVVEYSAIQRVFSVRQVGQMLRSNTSLIAQGVKVDYIPLTICADYEEAAAICERLMAEKRKECQCGR